MLQSIFGHGNLGLLFVFAMCGFTQVTCIGIQEKIPPKVTWRRGSQDFVVVPSIVGIKSYYVLTCTADGAPSPKIEWRRDDITLISPGSNLVKVFDNGTLIFPDFSATENGFYQCVAKSDLGVSVSAKILIMLQEFPDITAGNASVEATKNVFEGDHTSFECKGTLPAIPPDAYFRKWVYTQGSEDFPQTDRIGTDVTGTMRFSFVELKDARRYTCSLTPQIAESIYKQQFSNVVTLNVKIKEPTVVTMEPKLLYSSGNGNMKALLNKKATLECFFSGKPVSTITWLDNSNQVITSANPRFTIEDHDRRLVIKTVRDDDEGTFTCTASNGEGSDATGQIMVNVTSPPFKVANQGLTTETKAENEDVTLWCKPKAARGEHLDRPVWYRNWELFTEGQLPDPGRYSFSSDYTQLTIRKLNKAKDMACFQCNVTNSEGYLFYDGYLRVIDSIVIDKKPQEYIQVTDKDIIDISIRAHGDVCCSIDKSWSFNQQPLTREEMNTPPFTWFSQNDTILFNASDVSSPAVKSRLGKYSVRVSNQFQNMTVEFTISNKETGPIVAADAGFQLWWLAIIFGVLLIIIAILIIICCVKRNYPRETYQLEKTELQHNLNPKEELLDQSFQEI